MSGRGPWAKAGKSAAFTVLPRDAFGNALRLPFSPAVAVVVERTHANGTIQSLDVVTSTSEDVVGGGGAIRVTYDAPGRRGHFFFFFFSFFPSVYSIFEYTPRFMKASSSRPGFLSVP